ncbi:SHOCT domain-containing protein [Desulfitobacterium hafniense]|uniref:SHOCT domain-containing protein n=1 Tax=Desulfitobacterium hafniense TaxID=49338 RepID=UPI000372B029|nr:SHOCT domain-containing protein [Desulfitobacterium hafniense]
MDNITGAIPEINYEKKPVPQEQLQREVDYIRAQRILDSMLQGGLISLSEFNKITALNRKSFSPALAQIMPENR